MADNSRISVGFPFPVYVNETSDKERINIGNYINEDSPPPATVTTIPTMAFMGAGTT